MERQSQKRGCSSTSWNNKGADQSNHTTPDSLLRTCVEKAVIGTSSYHWKNRGVYITWQATHDVFGLAGASDRDETNGYNQKL